MKKNTRTDILAHLTAYHRERQLAPMRDQQKQLVSALDALDAWGALETIHAKHFSKNLCCGPAAHDGIAPQPWVGVMLWSRPAGYLGYKVLTLTGVWAIPENDAAQIIIGVRRIAYAQAFYDAEAYVKLIRKGFSLYYGDNGAPPPISGRKVVFTYDPHRRLVQRDVVIQALVACVSPT